MRRPLLAVVAGFVVGLAAPAPPHSLIPMAGFVLTLSPPLAPLGFVCAGWVAATVARSADGRIAPEQRLEGRIVSVPDRLGDRVRFLLRERSGSLFQVTSRPHPWPLSYGDVVRLDARLRHPEGQRNPGGRDRAAELAASGIDGEAFATSAPVRVAPPGWLAWLESSRDRFAEATAASLAPREAGLVRAIGTGDRAGVDGATADAFARSGLAHLLSVSGLHLAVVVLGTYRALRWIASRLDGLARRIDPRRVAAAACLPLALVYAIATGAQVPVVRSAIAVGLGLVAILLDREVEPLNVLAVAALAILSADPGALRDVSFQLSFVSVAGLALGAGPLRRALPIPAARESLAGRLGEVLLTAVCASVAATIATAPLVALHFRRISVVGVLSNVVGIPLGSALTIVAAAASVVTAAVPTLGAALLEAARPIAALLLWVNDRFASIPGGSPGVGSPGWCGAALFYAGLLAALRCRRGWRILAIAVATAALLGPPPIRHALAARRGDLEVTFLSVGQGDATALLLPDGSAVLVDGGGEAKGHYDPGARDVVPWLRDVGVTRIAALFLSHPHPDHLLGLPAVAAAFPVEHFFTNGRMGGEDVAAAFARLPRPERFVAGATFERAGVRFEALAPSGDHPEWTENDASLVLRVTHGAVRVLLCGDVEAEGEAALAAGADLAADVVKIPHHGSITSSGAALVSSTRASFAVACVGHENRFGFPDLRVVERWRGAGAQVLRTDEGAVRFLSNGRAIRRVPGAGSLDLLARARERI